MPWRPGVAGPVVAGSPHDASCAAGPGRLTPDVLIQQAVPAQRALLERLLQLYLHDFSEFAPRHTSYGEVDAEGLFPYPPGLDTYWQEPDREPLLIRADGAVAGFVLVNRWSALDRPLDRAVAEFFVLRKYRRAGVGTRAAHAVFRRHPGRWEVAVAAYNPAALQFWRCAAGSAPGGAQEHPGDGRRWSGTVLTLKA
jgi:predicted acetyltransferase